LQADDGRLAVLFRVVWTMPALIAVNMTDLSLHWRLLLSSGIAATAFRQLLRYAVDPRRPPVRATCDRDGRWLLVIAPGHPVGARVVGCWGRRHGPLIGLRWALEDGVTVDMWIAKWVTSASEWRRLRTRLQLS
jgi:hypothetical protein